MKKEKKHRGIVLWCGVFVLLLGLAGCSLGNDELTSGIEGKKQDGLNCEAEEQQENEKQPLPIEWIEARRLSRQQIRITWSDSMDSEVKEYIVKKRPAINGAGIGDWSVVTRVASDGQIDEHGGVAMDILLDDSICQFEYTVEPFWGENSGKKAQAGATIIASNLLVCIDPGHYAGENGIKGPDSYGYVEGDVALQIAQELQAVLWERYGISSCMTREDGLISLGGYTDERLDSAHITLRGTYAGKTGSDFFVSLHTNANEENANGYETSAQPIGINKPILIANTVASKSGTAVAVGNAIGSNLAKVAFEENLATVSLFDTGKPGQLIQWSDTYNDSLDMPGKLFCRLKENGVDDYYGVLRGAAEVGIPGIIIEHGMHTVPEVRRAIMEGDLIQRWAAADADGIAYGFGFVTEQQD